MRKRLLLLTVLCFGVYGLYAQHNNPGNYYHNPVIPGDLPDPTIIRVGNTYYAAGTTSDFAPHYPLHESSDLINWKQIGAIFHKTPEWTSDSFWAPELYYHNGTFYAFYAAKRKGDRISCIGVATTKNIYEGFTDQGILIEWGDEAIDAFVFRDDDEKFYIFWKAYGLTPGRPIEILGSELDLEGLSLIGEHFSVTDYDAGWRGHGDEGQSIFKRNGMYYMLYSNGGCCDNRCDYRVLVSRSKDLRSGWEQLPDPILEGGGQWLCTGHGTLVTTPDNRYFYMYHSYHATDFEYIGRQGMLDEMVWNETSGWPRFKNDTYASEKAEVPFQNTKLQREAVYFEDFSTDKHLKNWQWDINKTRPVMKRTSDGLELSSKNEGLVFTGISPKTGNFVFDAGVQPETSIQSGICIYGNAKNLLALTVKGNRLVLFSIKNGTEEKLAEHGFTSTDSIKLRLEAENGRYFRFFYSYDNMDWIELKLDGAAQFDGHFLPQWGAAYRTGLIFNSNDSGSAKFSYVRMENKFRN